MDKTNQDFYCVLKPLHFFGKCIGLSVWTLQEKTGSSEREYVISKKDVFWNATVIILFISGCISHYHCCPDRFEKVEFFAFALVKYTNYMTILELFFMTSCYKRRTMRIIEKITKVDRKITELTKQKFDYLLSRKYVFYYVLFCLLFIAFEAPLTILAAMNDGMSVHKEFRCALLTTISVLLNLYTNGFLFIMLYELKKRYLKVNHRLNYLAKNVHLNVPLVKELLEIKQVCDILTEIGKEINIAFQITLLFKLTTCTVIVLTLLFLITCGNFKSKPLSIPMYFGLTYWIVINMSDISLHLYHFVCYTDEAKKTVELMENVEKAVGKANLAYKQVELFSLQVYVENFKFTVFGYFPLDWTLLHSMVAGIATYLIIFHQFSNMEKRT